MEIEGNYLFRISKEGEWYVATGMGPETKKTITCANIITQGRTEEEIFMMIADAFMTSLDIKVSWWNRFLSRLMIFKR